PLCVGGERLEVESLRFVISERLVHQLVGTPRLRDRAVRVIRLRMLRAVIGKDDVGVVAAADRILQEEVRHRAVIAKPAVPRLIAEMLDLFARDRRRGVAEVDQHTQTDEGPDRLSLRRCEHRAACRRHRSYGTLLLSPLPSTLLAAPARGAKGRLPSRRHGALSTDAQTLRDASARAIEARPR